jgi:hypothetical protein
MRLDEWQKFIETQFLEEEPPPPPQKEEKAPEPAKFTPPPAQAKVNTPHAPPPKPVPPANREPNLWGLDTDIPDFEGFLAKKPTAPSGTGTPKPAPEPKPIPTSAPSAAAPVTEAPLPTPKRQSTTGGRRARHVKNVRPESVHGGTAIVKAWLQFPKQVEILVAMYKQDAGEVAQNSYKRPFAEKRIELIERIIDPILTLEETARLLNVCPTSVRRYTNRGILTCYRKEVEGGTGSATGKETRQRRFRLSDILAFLEAQQSVVEADRKTDALRLFGNE